MKPSTLLAFIGGALAGAAIALLYAPDKGENIRKKIKAKAEELGCPFIEKNSALISGVKATKNGMTFGYKGRKNLSLSLLGTYQPDNASNVIEAVEILRSEGLNIPEKALVNGLKNAVWKGRFERLCDMPEVYFDGGHNEDGGKAVAESLSTMLGGKKIFAVIGMMADKNVESYLEKVASLCSFVAATTVADNPRAMSAEELEEKAKKYCNNTVAFDSANDAIEYAKKNVADYDCLLVCGSLYLAGEVRKTLQNIF